MIIPNPGDQPGFVPLLDTGSSVPTNSTGMAGGDSLFPMAGAGMPNMDGGITNINAGGVIPFATPLDSGVATPNSPIQALNTPSSSIPTSAVGTDVPVIPTDPGTGPTPTPTPNPTPTPVPTTPTTGSPVNNLDLGTLLGLNDPAAGSQLNDIFGKGFGQLYANLLKAGGGFNPDINSALLGQFDTQNQRAFDNIRQTYANAGLSPSGSPFALASGDFWSQVAKNNDALVASNFNSALGRTYDLFGQGLDAARLNEANKSSAFDTISNILKLIGPLIGLGQGGALSNAIGGALADLLKKIGLGKGSSSGGASGGGGTSTGGTRPPGSPAPTQNPNNVDITQLAIPGAITDPALNDYLGTNAPTPPPIPANSGNLGDIISQILGLPISTPSGPPTGTVSVTDAQGNIIPTETSTDPHNAAGETIPLLGPPIDNTITDPNDPFAAFGGLISDNNLPSGFDPSIYDSLLGLNSDPNADPFAQFGGLWYGGGSGGGDSMAGGGGTYDWGGWEDMSF